jgi:hypothetical protein
VNDAILGIIAIAVVAIAIVQVAMFVWAMRVARRVGDSVKRLEQDVRPILAGLQVVASEAARAATAAAAQVNRVDEMLSVFRQRVDSTMLALHETILSPARDLLTLLQAVRDAFLGGGRRSAAGDSRRRQPAEDDDALFIG